MPFARVMDVKIKPDLDVDSEQMLEVQIIHDAPEDVKGNKNYGVLTILHEALNEKGHPGYPFTRFIWHKSYGDIA